MKRLETAVGAAEKGQVRVAFDTYLLAYRALTARWPAEIRTEEALDSWFDDLLPPATEGAEPDPLTEALSDLLWMRTQLEEEERSRRRQLSELAEDMKGRLDEDEDLRREALLTQAVVAVVDDEVGAGATADGLCARYPDDAWVRLELSRAYGRLRAPGRRDIASAVRYARQALTVGDDEAEIYVFEDLNDLLEESGRHAELVRFLRSFWTPERIGRALRVYGPEPPASAIRAVRALGKAAVPLLVAVLTDPAVHASVATPGAPVDPPPDDDFDDDLPEPLWWAAVHALRLVASLRAADAAPAVVDWLSCDEGAVRDLLPLVAARLGAAGLDSFLQVVEDRARPLRARALAITCVTAVALRSPRTRARVLRVLRAMFRDETVPRGLRTEAAYRLAMLRDRPSRAHVLEALGAGVIDAFLFDAQDVVAFYEDKTEDPRRELGVDLDPLAVYAEQDRAARDSVTGPSEQEVDALARLLDTLSLPPQSPGQAGRASAGGATARLDRARSRFATLAMQQLDLSAWHDALLLFTGAGKEAARECLRLELEWPFADFLTLDVSDRDGQTLADHLLSDPPLMSAEERDAANALAQSRVVLLEVLDSGERTGGPTACRELPSGARRHVVLPEGMQSVRWDLLLGRVVPLRDAPHVLLYALRVPRDQRDPVVQGLATASRRLGTATQTHGSAGALDRQAASVFMAQLLRVIANAGPPRLRDVDGADILFCEAVYDVLDPTAVEAALALFADFAREEGGSTSARRYRWLAAEEEAPPMREARRLLGEIVLRDTRMVLSCHTRERLVEGRKRIEQAARDALRHRADTFTDPSAMAKEIAGTNGEPLDPETRALVAELLERHYEGWLDEQLPALGGSTPQEAAHDPKLRPALEELVRVIENIEGHRALSQGVAYDTTRLRVRLDLEPQSL